MAVHSGWLHEEQVRSAKRRGVPAVSTLENPPGDEVAGSAWMLPELEKSLENTGSMVVQFNTCAFQRRVAERWYKPAQWAGRLEGLERLNRKCNCPSWASHTSLKGKRLTEAAGEYPQELAEEVAKLIILIWKRVLGLEYWRHKVETCAEEVSQYSKVWLEAERNRKSPPGKKRVWKVAFQETSEEDRKVSEKTEGKRVASVAFEGDDVTEDVRPKSSALPSKKERKIKDDDFAIGGMRHPKKAVDRLHLVKGCGMQIRNEWELFYLQNPQAKLVAKDYGTKDAVMDEEVLIAWRKKLEKIFGAEDEEKEKDIVKLAYEFRSPLKAHLWEAWQKKTKDPDEHLAGFIRHGVPLGMAMEIPSSGGIFPRAEPASGDKN